MSSRALQVAIATSLIICSLTSAPAEAKRLIRGSVGKAASKVGHATGISQTIAKVSQETTNLAENTEEAVRESGRYLGRQGELVVDVHKELLKGDFYEAQKLYVNGTVDNSVKALQESSMLRMGATIVASAYGGPAAAGGLNGYLVLKTTGDKDQAWKTAFISTASSWATGEISGYKSSGATEIAAAATANGAVSGAAVSALGGDFQEGFERGALGSLANTYYQHVTGDSPDTRVPDGAPYPKASDSFPTTEEALRAMDEIPRNRPWTGKETFNLDPPKDIWQAWARKPFGGTEDSGLMMTIAKAPVVNPGSVFHDYLSVQNGWNFPELQLTIPPAFALTGIAMHLPEQNLLFDSAIDNSDSEKK